MAGKVDLKVVLLGKEYGGKTSLVERYIHDKFNAQAPYQSVSGDHLCVCVDALFTVFVTRNYGPASLWGCFLVSCGTR